MSMFSDHTDELYDRIKKLEKQLQERDDTIQNLEVAISLSVEMHIMLENKIEELESILEGLRK